MKQTRLYWILQRHGLRQRDVLEAMERILEGTSEKPIQKYILSGLCRGERKNPRMSTLEKVANAIGTDVSNLIPVDQKITMAEFIRWAKGKNI